MGIALVAVLSLSAGRVYGESANSDFKHGQDAEARQDYDAAFNYFQKAAQKNPKDLRYRTALDRVRTTNGAVHVTRGRKLFQAGDMQGALAEFLHAAEIDPGNEAAQQEIAKVRRSQGQTAAPSEIGVPLPSGQQQEISSMGSPVLLKPMSNEPLTLHMSEDAKVVYQAIGKAAGVNVLFDPDFNAKRIQVDLTNVSLMDALRVVGTMSNTFWRPVTQNTIFVAANTRVKHTDLDEQAVQTFYLANAWQQNDLQDVQSAIRNVIPTIKAQAVASQNALVVRGTPDELLLAEKLINDLDKPRSEVVVDFGILEVSKTWEKTLGLAWPSSFGAALMPPNETGTTTSSSSTGTTTSSNCNSSGTCLTLSNLAHLNSNDFAITVGSATLNLLLSDNNTQILQDPRIRATDGQKASLKIGSKIPIATGSYSAPGLTATAAIGYAQTQFQYIDVGVNIEVTPTVHFDNDVTLKVHVEVSTESGQESIEGVTEPILSQRVAEQVIRLREGEASILGGIQDNETLSSWSGIPGLSSIPVLKYLFGSKDKQIKDDEIVFVVVPHVVRGQSLGEDNLRAVDTGAGQSIELRHVAGGAPAGQPAVRPAALERQNFGTIPAGAAPEAATAALNQLRTSAENFDQPHPAAPAANPAPQATPSPALKQQPAAQPVPVAAAAPPQVNAAPAVNPPAAAATAPALAAGGLSFVFQPPAGTTPVGTNIRVPITLNGGADVSSVPLQLRYDPTKLTLVNVTSGDLLSKDGQATALIHRDDGPGNVTVVTSRPPGAAGVTGSGVVCVLTFQAKATGQTAVTMTRAGVVNSKQQQVNGAAAPVSIVVK